MGLFDRFKKRVDETEKEGGLTTPVGSEEAADALAFREDTRKKVSTPEHEVEPPPTGGTQGQWEEIEDGELSDPFSAPLSPKERKRAERERATREAEKPPKAKPKRGAMESTTGRPLVSATPTPFQVDLGEDSKSRGGRLIKGGATLDALLDELAIDLMSADMGHDAVSELVSELRDNLVGARVSRKSSLDEVVERALRRSLASLLEAGYWDFDATVRKLATQEAPVSIMMVGVNGTGKTTTTAKIAKRLTDEGYEVVLAAADTFRAGAIEQLATHAERLGVRCIKSQRGGDSAAIARDAIESATARGADIVIIDTAGRMQNKSNLMEELRKVHRVTQPDLVIFVADALAGNDAVTQATEFQRMLTFDGAALCKLDTDARGGAALSIAHATGRPIVLAGVGQGYDDLEPFRPDWLLDNILG